MNLLNPVGFNVVCNEVNQWICMHVCADVFVFK